MKTYQVRTKRYALSAFAVVLATAVTASLAPSATATAKSGRPGDIRKAVVTQTCNYYGEMEGTATARVTFATSRTSSNTTLVKWSVQNKLTNYPRKTQVPFTVNLVADGNPYTVEEGTVRARGRVSGVSGASVSSNETVEISMWVPVIASGCTIVIEPPNSQ